MRNWFRKKTATGGVELPREWIDGPPDILGQNWRLVDYSDERIVCEISHDPTEKKYCVWKRGAGIGEFLTLSSAKQAAERCAR